MKKMLFFILALSLCTITQAQNGSGEFANELKIGQKPNADTSKAGMIQYIAGDFQGFNGAAWKSFLELGVSYMHVITVAQSGGDFNSVLAGINACGITSPTNPCHVRVMPGIYNEPLITVPNNVHLLGAGKNTTVIIGQLTLQDSCTVTGFHITSGLICTGTSPKISSNLIENPSGAGIWVDGSVNRANPWIENNHITNCQDYGIRCTGGSGINQSSDPWIIQNRIDSNLTGGIICTDNAWPTISNNELFYNYLNGIVLVGNTFPTEPTITDNIVAHTIDVGGAAGVGIRMLNLAEPRIMTNDLYGNKIGIVVLSVSQPSIISNNINYNDSIGIFCSSPGAGVKKVVIQSNHIHSNGFYGISIENPGDPVVSHNQISHQQTGIIVGMTTPFIFQNTIINNILADIQYNAMGPFPVINTNVYDNIFPGGLAAGIYNSTSLGAAIGP